MNWGILLDFRFNYLIYIFHFIFCCVQPVFSSENSCLSSILKTVVNKPETVHARLAYGVGKDDAEKIFKLYSAPYSENKKVIKILEKLTKGKDISFKEIEILTGEPIRVIKKLRNAFVSVSVTHEVPASIDDLATILGHVKDGLAVGDKEYVIKQSNKALTFFENGGHEKILTEIQKFKAADSNSLSNWIGDQVVDIKAELSASKITPREFHETRKKVARLQVFYSAKYELTNDAKLKPVLDALNKVYKEMGDQHDIFMADRILKKIDYEADLVPFPAKTKAQLQDVLNTFEN